MTDTRFDGYPTDDRFKSPGVDDRFPSPGTDTQFDGFPTDARFPDGFAEIDVAPEIPAWSIDTDAERVDTGETYNGKPIWEVRSAPGMPFRSPISLQGLLVQGGVYDIEIEAKQSTTDPAASQFTFYMGGPQTARDIPAEWGVVAFQQTMGSENVASELQAEGWYLITSISIVRVG